MPEKKQPPSAAFRRTLYWDESMESQTVEVAKRLKAQGVDGLYNAKGELNRSTVIRYLLQKELGRG
jgi:hypothetical protein